MREILVWHNEQIINEKGYLNTGVCLLYLVYAQSHQNKTQNTKFQTSSIFTTSGGRKEMGIK